MGQGVVMGQGPVNDCTTKQIGFWTRYLKSPQSRGEGIILPTHLQCDQVECNSKDSGYSPCKNGKFQRTYTSIVKDAALFAERNILRYRRIDALATDNVEIEQICDCIRV